MPVRGNGRTIFAANAHNHIQETFIMERLDETDLELLRLLQKDATLTTRELAQKVHLSPTPQAVRKVPLGSR